MAGPAGYSLARPFFALRVFPKNAGPTHGMFEAPRDRLASRRIRDDEAYNGARRAHCQDVTVTLCHGY